MRPLILLLFELALLEQRNVPEGLSGIVDGGEFVQWRITAQRT
ncbi:hypothetical protein [Pseudomonas californiensis]|nr:hypothetical protein [Pseudomonas californiensis]